MIDVKELTKEFSIDGKVFKAVDRVSFKVDKGEVYGIIGLSGAGKSTLIRCINRLEEPTSGNIIIDGVDITTLNKKELLMERKDIGMIFQSFNLFSQKTVYENIAYPLELVKENKGKIKERVMELLDFVDLKDKKNAYPSEISGGQKQRVAIARALATNPKVLLSDEGTSALDPANTKQILELLKKTVRELGMTVIMITHQMEVAKDICDRIAVMENGRIIEENNVEQLFKAPKKELTMSFIQSLGDKTDEEVINSEEFKGKVLRITYSDDSAKEPVLSDLIKKFDITVNLISGNINKLGTTCVGYMIIEVFSDYEVLGKAMQYLEEKNIHVEVM